MKRVRLAEGFTLIELLVVVAIITVLIAVLLPSLGRARDQARTAACAANLHGIGLAGNTYASEYEGVLPYADTTPLYANTSPQYEPWPKNWWNYKLNSYCQSKPETPGTTVVFWTLLTTGTFTCPGKSDYLKPDSTNVPAVQYQRVSYYWNKWAMSPIGDRTPSGGTILSAPNFPYVKLSTLPSQSDLVLVTEVDGTWVGGPGVAFGDMEVGTYPALYHHNVINALEVDGHVELVPVSPICGITRNMILKR